MSAGLSSRFSILQQSPHDTVGSESVTPEPTPATSKTDWVPSRYNIRAVTEDGRLILWNTFRGTMSVFPAVQRATIEAFLSKKGFTARPEGTVGYLRDRGYLIQAGTDEYRRIELGFGQQHYRTDLLELVLLASEDCNFRCQYCYEEFARGTMEPRVRRGVKSLVESRLKTLSSLTVGWFGGEPLYGMPAIDELAPFFLQTAQKHGLSFFSHMTTNGYLLTPEVADKLLGWKITQYQITVDGPPESHDCNRPTRDGQGTFQTIYDNLRALSRRDDELSVDLRVNFDRNNHPHLRRFLDLVERDFQDDPRFKLRFRAVGKWGGPNDDQLAVCGVKERESIAEELKQEARKRGLSLGDGLREVKSFGSQVCYAARPYNFVIGASGKVMKCTIDLDMLDRNVVGRLTEEGELELDDDKMALWTEAAFQRDPQCQKCVVLPTCQGIHCPQVRMDTGKSPCTPLRRSAKAALLETLDAVGAAGRKVVVPRQSTDQRPSAPRG